MSRLVFVFLAASLLGAQEPPPKVAPPVTRSLTELRLFFQQSCARCHGRDGSATGPDGKRLKGRNFTSQQEMKGTTDTGLAKTVRKGIFMGMVMPAFKDQLSEEEALILVKEIVRKAKKGEPIAPKADADRPGNPEARPLPPPEPRP